MTHNRAYKWFPGANNSPTSASSFITSPDIPFVIVPVRPVVRGEKEEMTVVRVRKNIPVASLVLDPVVQRIRHEFRPVMREANLARLEKDWDIAKCDPLLGRELSDGRIGVGHGGHRFEVARRLGLDTLPFDVVQGLNGQGDPYWVELCLASHDERQWEPLNKYLVRLEAGSEPEVSIEAILGKLGTRTATTANNGYVCVDKLRKLFELDLLQSTVRVIEAAWPKSVVGHSGIMVDAVGTFIRAYKDNPQFTVLALSEKLERRDPADLIRDARSRNAALRIGVQRLLCQSIRDVYNKGRRTLLPEFKQPRALVAKH